jgi:hypothetical protein
MFGSYFLAEGAHSATIVIAGPRQSTVESSGCIVEGNGIMRYEIIFTIVLLAGQGVFAQQTVQQPVVGVTSVNTTVSVPDRGTMFLGGVSSAESGRTQYGPLRTGPSTGLTRQSSSMSVSVYIHDLQAMDEAILNSAPSFQESHRPVPGLSSRRSERGPMPEKEVSPVEKAIKFEQLARKADEAGKTGVAKLHWQMAAKYGSKAADERLAELTKPSAPKSTKTAAR